MQNTKKLYICNKVCESKGKVSKVKIGKNNFEFLFEMNEYLNKRIFLTLQL